MNVLFLQPKTPYSFWSFDQLLKLTGRKALLPPLGLITVAALLPQEWNMRLIDRNFQEIREEMWNWSELVMISGMIAQSDDVLWMTREAKRRGKTVVVGGPYATLLPEELRDAGADFVVKGEAETALPLLLDALTAGIKSEVIEEPSKPAMVTSPIPRFDLLRLDAYDSIGIQTSRGCPYNCEFCNVTTLHGKKTRYKEVHQIIAELEFLLSLGRRGTVFVSDDNFIGNINRARSILETLIPWHKAHGEPFNFWTQVSVNLGQNPELIDLMTHANFHTVFVGIETPDEEVLTFSGKHQNVSNPLAESIGNMNANGLTVVGSFIVGLDNEKEGADDRMVAFAEQTGIPVIMLNVLHPLPQSALWYRLKQENRLVDERGHGLRTGGELSYVPTRPTAQIMKEYKSLTDRLYEPSAFLGRTYRFYLAMRPSREALGIETEADSPPVNNGKTSKKQIMRDLKSLVFLFWRQGIVRSTRIQFWRQLIGLWRSNPSRLSGYAVTLFHGENLFALRKRLLNGDNSSSARIGSS
jgi:radical SAM superfamily enzyme YgiQ (UPF0313 family)